MPDAPSPIIDQDLHCANCKYNLRTLKRDGVCPECGFSIATSLQRAEYDWPTDLVCLLIVGSVVAFTFSPARAIPGSFLSILRDIVPVALNLAAMIVGIATVRRVLPGRRVVHIALILVATLLVTAITAGVLSFWLNPLARGPLLSW